MRWIKLDTSITQWEWFQEPNTFRLWIYLIINANYKDVKFMGMTLRRGQHILSTRKIADDMGVSQNTVLRSLNQLTESKCIVIENLGKMGSLITIVNYDKYQNDSPDNDDETPSASVIESHTESHTESDTESHAESRNRIEKEIYKEKEITVVSTTVDTHPPKPTIDEIQQYITDKGYTDIDAEAFWNFYESKNWMIGKNKMSKWKSAIATWHRKNLIEQKQKQNIKHTDNDTNQIDSQNRRLCSSLQSTYEALRSGQLTCCNDDIRSVRETLFD